MKRIDARKQIARAGAQLRAHAGQILYCAALALALTAIAFAAERYRSGRGANAPAASLPTLELSGEEVKREEPAPEFALPEGARRLRGHSDAPAWNAALGMWESHPATDWSFAGGEVESLCAGTVRAVGASGALGGFVEVAHGDLLLRYASIAPNPELTPGAELSRGDPLGVADASMPGESALGAHLHLEAIRGGERIDPEELLRGD